MKVPALAKSLSPQEVSEILGVTTHTLAVWRCDRRYNLPYFKSGRLVRYREQDVSDFIEGRLQNSGDSGERS